MGCVSSRASLDDRRDIFSVWNVDDRGNHLNAGKIEVTESDLILHQHGKGIIRWPLRSLRRYGFDAELFSFECGRRCPTGPGIYAFKCRRAELLFNVLQEFIQNTGGSGRGSVGGSVTGTPADQNNVVSTGATLSASGSVASHLGHHSLDNNDYLEPIRDNASTCPSGITSPRAIGTPVENCCCVLRNGRAASVTGSSLQSRQETATVVGNEAGLSNLCSLSSGNRHASPHYMNEEIFTHMTRSTGSFACPIAHQYVNSILFEDNTHKCVRHSLLHGQHPYVNGHVPPCGHLTCGFIFASHCQARCPHEGGAIPCTHCVDLNTNYTKLDELMKQEQTAKQQKEHFYVNVNPDISNGSSSTKCGLGNKVASSTLSRSNTLTSPTAHLPNCAMAHLYVNVGSPSSEGQKEQTYVDESTNEEADRQMNYIILDLNHGNDKTNAITSPLSPPASIASLSDSPLQQPEGYATIDFDKTAALSNSANPSMVNDDSVRKTRHNGIIPSGSP
ncbi:uncharacterized protein LOC106459027 [Limulus polyphemus]|uniref:Uncharacterized protein LOC106459027 n=1 Tax=Limulus polyphemus TaxID=6850 RepID=A0ABM1B3H3_LIMPO|nr:uncharacterized protein LOC106459027 [Limulus polyphemus]XP_022241108.1 uncharacterized protein LOC106459027 [Limulus polyphemus]XP_022241109.1 uncharacterized protein LOC106459027 [Limulus polyphemus]XP_022241110.1 uncharacterized protein LOC106459027 [Limulus polyphemus]XP_022241111.1 uncharacterized protein LOC106459027 [Limulus polyphemus]XP_022241112.1 uncharacterized protein LOC106459027 [Limulus polyphemus]XP_022241113.1 uncharacterized protein LOC106459027 [Limulus polyphemus]XP_0